MIIGIPKEIKTSEYRVGLTPASVSAFKEHGHEVMIQRSAGAESGYYDNEYIKAGASIIKDARELYSKADMIIKVI